MINDEIRKQTDKLKDMDIKQRLQYIWDYYKLHIILVLVVLFAVFSFIRDKATSKQTVFYVAMLDSNVTETVQSTLLDGFADTLDGFDSEHETMMINADYDTKAGGQIGFAFIQKIVADYSVGAIDATIAPLESIREFAEHQAYGDLSELLPDEMYEKLKKDGYDFIYVTYEDPATGEKHEYPAAVDITSTPYIEEGFTDLSGEHHPYYDDRCYYAISPNSSHPDTCIAFLSYLLDI